MHISVFRFGRVVRLGTVLAFVGAILWASSALAQVRPSAQQERHPARHFDMQQTTAKMSGASHSFDARYYHIRIDIDFPQESIGGTTRVEGAFTSAASELQLDLLSNMLVSDVRDGAGRSLSFDHADDVLTIELGDTLTAASPFAVEIDYSGQPQDSGFGAFRFALRDGTPVAWTLSEPYGSRAWWPGKDHPSDKPDSARVTVTVPEGLRVGSNGILASETENGGRITYDWVVDYPIAPYLLSLAAGPYAVFEQTYVRPDSLADELGPLMLPVIHYKYVATDTTELPAGWAEVLDAMAVFEWWFGAYPFPDEKYGHAEFGWGGGMEHQTMSSMGSSSVGLVTHELAHQWFGDAVTTRTWPHLWLNEGFASYAEILYWEAMADRYPGAAESAVRVDQIGARSAQGTLVVEDTLDVRNLFAGSRVYAKGSMVLHMLRNVIGDENFRIALKAYIADPSLAYGTAVTDDFRRVAETVSGRSLETFFRQWVTEGTGYPIYTVTASQRPAPDGGFDVEVTVRQTQTSAESNVNVFVMPITLAIDTRAGEQRFVVENTEREQTFRFHTDSRPNTVRFDPDGVLLSNEDVAVNFGGPIPTEFAISVSPNPTDGQLRITVELPTTDDVEVLLYDAIGRRIKRLWRGTGVAGTLPIHASVDGLAAGTYFISVLYQGSTLTSPVTVVR